MSGRPPRGIMICDRLTAFSFRVSRTRLHVNACMHVLRQTLRQARSVVTAEAARIAGKDINRQMAAEISWSRTSDHCLQLSGDGWASQLPCRQSGRYQKPSSRLCPCAG